MALTEPGGGGAGDTVLVLRDLGLGDALTAVPALRGLRRAHPASRLVLAGPVAIGQWFRSIGLVDTAVPGGQLAAWRGGPPDLAVNLHGRGPESHRALLALSPRRLLAYANEEAGHPVGPRWSRDRHEVHRWCDLVQSDGGDCGPEDLRLESEPSDLPGCVVLHPGAAAAARRWPLDRWSALAGHLLARGMTVALTGSGDESALCAALASEHPRVRDLSGRLDLRALAALVGAAALVVCGDTGVAHLATATGTPSVLLFGPVSPALWGPAIDHQKHLVLWRPQPDDPPGDPHADRVDPRLSRIDVESVLCSVEEVLQQDLSRLPARSS